MNQRKSVNFEFLIWVKYLFRLYNAFWDQSWFICMYKKDLLNRDSVITGVYKVPKNLIFIPRTTPCFKIFYFLPQNISETQSAVENWNFRLMVFAKIHDVSRYSRNVQFRNLVCPIFIIWRMDWYPACLILCRKCPRLRLACLVELPLVKCVQKDKFKTNGQINQL